MQLEIGQRWRYTDIRYDYIIEVETDNFEVYNNCKVLQVYSGPRILGQLTHGPAITGQGRVLTKSELEKQYGLVNWSWEYLIGQNAPR